MIKPNRNSRAFALFIVICQVVGCATKSPLTNKSSGQISQLLPGCQVVRVSQDPGDLGVTSIDLSLGRIAGYTKGGKGDCLFIYDDDTEIESQVNFIGSMKNRVKELKNLEVLRMAGLELGSLEFLRELRKLKILDLSFTAITTSEMDEVSRLINLEEIYLSGNCINEAGVEKLLECTHLEIVGLDGINIPFTCLERLVRKSSISTLYIRGNEAISESDLVNLRSIRGINIIETWPRGQGVL